MSAFRTVRKRWATTMVVMWLFVLSSLSKASWTACSETIFHSFEQKKQEVSEMYVFETKSFLQISSVPASNAV